MMMSTQYSNTISSSNMGAPQSYSMSIDEHKKYNDHRSHYYNPNLNNAYNNNNNITNMGSRARQNSLRRRGSSMDPDRRMEEEHIMYHNYRHDQHDNNNSGNNNARRTTESFATTRQTHKPKITISTTRLSRILTLVIVCMLMFWGSFWGIETCIGLARGAFQMIAGKRHQHSSSYYDSGELDDDIQTNNIVGSEDYTSEDVSEDNNTEDESESSTNQANSIGLRGASDVGNDNPSQSEETPQHLSIHDLNALSHQKKAEGRQIINDKPMEEDEDGKGDKAYMGHDSTKDFFFAGGTNEKKRVVNRKGRIETKSYPAHSYALLPVLMDMNPFAISIWVYLSPLVDKKRNLSDEDSRRPRVILSTSSKHYQGCHSDVFGGRATTGIVLYAQPHYGDNAESDGGGDTITYRIVLEYARSGKKLCRTLIGSRTNAQLVREGEWHHITIFATRTASSSDSGEERISLYVDGDLAGRNEHETRQFSSYHSDPKTIIGRYATQVGSQVELSSRDNYDLEGRVGMLSFWETGGNNPTLASSMSKQMKIESTNDEDHVVRAINRAAFDIRAIEELSLQGLFVKEPTLLYTFDGQRQQQSMLNELYSEYSDSPKLIREVMSGKKNGHIMSELEDGMMVHEKQAFIPLGGNRYSEYKDGTFVPPKLTFTERQELNEIARARSGIVKKAMQHVWNGYEKYGERLLHPFLEISSLHEYIFTLHLLNPNVLCINTISLWKG